MHWSRAILSFLAIGLPLVSAQPVSAASASLAQRSAEITNVVPSVQVSTPNGHVLENDGDKEQRRSTLVARNNDVVVLKEYDVAFLDPEGKNSKVYLTSKQNDLGKRPKSDKTLKTTVAVKTSSLGPCFALAIVDDKKGGLLGHFTPPFCRWLDDPKSVSDSDAAAATYSKAALVKLLGKKYKNDLEDSEVYIVHGPASDAKSRDTQETKIKEILKESKIEDKKIERFNVPSHSGEPGAMDDATFAKRIITLEQQQDRKLTLKMGDQVLRG